MVIKLHERWKHQIVKLGIIGFDSHINIISKKKEREKKNALFIERYFMTHFEWWLNVLVMFDMWMDLHK